MKIKKRLISIVQVIAIVFSLCSQGVAIAYSEENEVEPASTSANVVQMELEPPQQTEYSADSDITTNINISGSTLTEPLEGSYLEITMPTTLNNNEELTTTSYLDNFSVSTEGVSVIKSEEMREENGQTIYRINFNTIDTTTQIQLPYTFSFTDELTPEDYRLQPIVILYDQEGNVLSEQEDQEYSPLYPEIVITDPIEDEGIEKQVVDGGVPGSDTDEGIAPKADVTGNPQSGE